MYNHRISKRRQWLIYGGLFLLFLLWQWNGLVFDFWTGYDMGVQNMELLSAASERLRYGKDLVFTPYPPLGWLYKGVVPALTNGHGEALFQSFTINILSALLRVAVIALFWSNAKDKTSKGIAILVSVFVFLRMSVQRGTFLIDLFILTAELLICSILTALQNGKNEANGEQVPTAASVIAVSVLLAVPQLVKFSYIAMAAALLIVTSAILLVYKRYSQIPLMIAGYVGTTCLLWGVSGERLQDLPTYVNAMFHFVSGYSEVMSLPFSAYENAVRDFIFALAVCVGYGLVFLYFLFRDRWKAAKWFIAAPFLFLIFKEAFVRSDAHTMAFMQELPYALCFLLFVLQQDSARNEASGAEYVCVWAKWICGGLLSLLILSSCVSNGWYPTSTVQSDYQKIGSEESYEATIAANKEGARSLPEYQALFADIEPYPNKSLGMLSGEQTFFIAYDLMDRFKLNPIVSLWENLTSYSELAAADQYYRADAPGILLYRPEPLDNGYFVFRMGTILRALLENYQVEKVDENGYLVLSHNEQRKSEAVELGEPFKASTGSPINIPTADNAFVFMKIDWKLTALGKLSSFILKLPQTDVTIQTATGTRNYRFFRTLANNGLYVSSLVDSSKDLADLISGDSTLNMIESITLHGDSRFYQKEFEVSFYAVPYTTEQKNYQESRISISADFSSELPAGNYQFFYAQDGMFNGDQMETIAVSQGQNQVTGIIPENGWNSLRLDFPSLTYEYDLLSIECNGKTAVIDGANDAEVTKTENGWHIKAGDYDPFVVFHLD